MLHPLRGGDRYHRPCKCPNFECSLACFAAYASRAKFNKIRDGPFCVVSFPFDRIVNGASEEKVQFCIAHVSTAIALIAQ